jgi:exonuclease III
VFLEEASCTRERKRDILLRTWNVRSLYRVGSLRAAARLARYKLDLVGVQEVRWNKGGTVLAGNYNFFYGNGNENQQLRTGRFVHQQLRE